MPQVKPDYPMVEKPIVRVNIKKGRKRTSSIISGWLDSMIALMNRLRNGART